MAETASLEPISVEQDGRILTGVDVTPEDLTATMTARPEKPIVTTSAVAAPPVVESALEEPDDEPAPQPGQPDLRARNADGTFKKPTRGQKRFDELTREREDAKRDAQAERTRREALERELAALKTPATVEKPGTSAAVTYPDHLKTFDAFLAASPTAQYEDWLEARADHRFDLRSQTLTQSLDARHQSRIEGERAARTVAEQVAAHEARGRTTYPDFDAVVNAQTEPIFSPLHLQAIIDADDAEHLMYHLAKDPTLASTVAAERDPIRLGRLLSQVAARAVATTASTASPRGTTTAPAPIQPIGSSSKTTVPTLQDLAASGDDYDSSGYRERRKAELQGVHRR